MLNDNFGYNLIISYFNNNYFTINNDEFGKYHTLVWLLIFVIWSYYISFNSKLIIQIKSLEIESKQKCNELENQITELKEKYYNIEKRNFYFQTSSEESSLNLEGDSSDAESD